MRRRIKKTLSEISKEQDMKMFKLKQEAKRKQCKKSYANYEVQIRATDKDTDYTASSKTECNRLNHTQDVKSMQVSKDYVQKLCIKS